ncbi:fumarylacetoacetate hydrolase family protein [Massilia yuzhufengensis]|uniref:2-keto-4-pentenoate hydratase/2-oxohepta-3-ene-1,7-dioic acid hydratase (Catechol pathway) n=1 Tax=Massilia yuzhufengensis TaxID=1164594 RepID=A0A1I1IXE1_9BURK|nr:fumarylacetoacetate hydrolase family protein [Massilia yuzhufengensis]SFC40947.1 2-keto-4-pentenoate hydratase/2-oxohepta-3-ene-1,7-dioic acid hydratase (catechol pathway) [Massilia yuzhufengensis]
MKIARCAGDGAPFWALVDSEAGSVRPIAGAFADWGPALTRAIASGRAAAGEDALPFAGPARPLAGLRLLPPVEPVNRVVVAGANYAKHLAADFGLRTPQQPIAFLKAYGALIGANDPIRYPPLTKELDHEVELVVVIGDGAIIDADPLAAVLGYMVGNDVSARDLQRSGPAGIGMDLFAAKSQDRSTGVGPWIVTRDEFAPGSPQLRLTLKVNGQVRQDASTAEMTWDVAQLVRFVQARSSFAAGDIMFTGSPAGVGQGTGLFLEPGDVVEASVEGIGAISNVVGPRSGA